MDRMKTLIHHDGALGDALLSLTCIDAIKADSSSVHVQGRQDVVAFLKETGCVDAASSSGASAYASLYTAADLDTRKFLSRFDRAFVFTARSDSPLPANIGALIPDTRTVGTIPPDDVKIHVALYRLAQLFPDRLSAEPPVLHCSQQSRDGSQSLIEAAGYVGGRMLIAVHPGSGGKSKCWRLDRYFELVVKLRKSCNPFFLLFSGPAEGLHMKKQIDRFSLGCDDVLHVSGMELIQAASLLSLCSLYIGNDSGFTHLAAAMGCAVIALFGPTDPVLWRPTGPRVEVVSAGFPGSLDEITVASVYEKAVSLVPVRSSSIAVPARREEEFSL
ncbi:MAG: glycosyltransferase family 9 protein [Betaproteobacteria bacterium]